MKTKNKHGFTLIELLAVIVVLAIIALIATPIVMKTIKNAKKGAAERSADRYIKQVETTVATERLEGNVLEGEYTIQSDGDICPVAGCTIDGKDKKVKIEVSGNKPKSGTIKIESGQVTLTSTMDIGGCNVTYDSTNKKYVASEKGSTPSSTVVYRWSEDDINIGDTINPSDTSKFTKDASTLGRNAYLKHVLDKDNKVTESYVCAILKGKEYCVRGGNSSFYGYAENEADYTGTVLILKNLRDAKIEGITCVVNAGTSGCDDNSVSLNGRSDGDVNADDGAGGCNVNGDGSSACESY